MERKYCVYKHTTPNGKVYIGVTSQKPSYRFANGNGYKCCRYFYQAIQKYGWENISHEILETGLTQEQASERERHYISVFHSNEKEYGYNLTDGGITSFEMSESTRALKSLNSKKMWQSEAYREDFLKRMSGKNNPMYGKHPSDETRAKMSASKKGKKHGPMSNATKKKLSEIRKSQGNFRLGKKHSEETKAKISKSNLGKNVVITDETKKKISDALTGIKRSEQTRERMSEAQKIVSASRKKSVIQIRPDNEETIAKYSSLLDAANSVSASSSTLICQCCKGKIRTAYGYIWKYAS